MEKTEIGMVNSTGRKRKGKRRTGLSRRINYGLTWIDFGLSCHTVWMGAQNPDAQAADVRGSRTAKAPHRADVFRQYGEIVSLPSGSL